ncbi:MAG: DmsE family decaheme c-type cytochrome [Magnetococcales bacterium]|nr:DmsE family decaheme c-type cytochrome [Magnetococcales bacterium]
MKFLWRIAMVCVFSAGMAWIVPAWATEQALQPGQLLVSGKVLEGRDVCMHCHDENDQKPTMTILKTRHGVKGDKRTPECQGCHGLSDSHIHNAGGGPVRPKPDMTYGPKSEHDATARSEKCLGCHEGGKRMHWAGSQHQGQDVACNSCHNIHAADDKVLDKTVQREVCFKCHKNEQAQVHRLSTHPLDAGKMSCSDCHNPHGSVGPKLLVKNTVNETCFTCHAEKRGPFLWEHPPVAEDCLNCHTPHGSNVTPLLKNRAPFLCRECHSGHGAPYDGSKLPTAAAGGVTLLLHGCANCHSQVHGSNHPSGSYFQR